MTTLYKLGDNEWTIVNTKKKTTKKIQKDKYETTYKYNNFKKVLCKNMIIKGRCIYGDKCVYAHRLEEQNVTGIRKIAYDIIKNGADLKRFNITKDKLLYNTLKTLTQACDKCIEGKCTGGYNCKNGTCDKKYVVCVDDLMNGKCKMACNKVHLTKRGLIPHNESPIKQNSDVSKQRQSVQDVALKDNIQISCINDEIETDILCDIFKVIHNTKNKNSVKESIFKIKIEDVLCE